MASPNRYALDRVIDAPEWAQQMQDSMQRALDRVSGDADTIEGTATGASSYTPARTADWAGTAPSSLAEAVDRLAYHIASGAGTAAIVELP